MTNKAFFVHAAVTVVWSSIAFTPLMHAGDLRIPGLTLSISSTSNSNVTNTNNNSNSLTKQNHTTTTMQAPAAPVSVLPSAPVAVTANAASNTAAPSNIFSDFKLSKPKTAAITMGVAYITMVATLYGMAYVCQYACPWARWQKEVSLAKLRKISERELAATLFEELQAQYADEQQDEEDFLRPLVCFMNAIDREIAWHKNFLSLHAWLDYCLIFPKQQAAQKSIAVQYQRLTYIRSILVGWLTNEEMRHDSKRSATH